MYDPAMRVLNVLELLQSREEVTGAELARRLEVSPRSVQRYVARLQDLGIPVVGRRGVGGAYRLQPGFRLPPLMFSAEEALSLALGLKALKLVGLDALAPAAETASAKLSRSLPTRLREDMGAMENAVQLAASPWVVSTDAALLAELMRAVRGAQVVELSYCSQQGTETRRQVQVYQVVYFSGRWYAVGWCLLRSERRSFRLDRIQNLEVQAEQFTPPDDFDAVAFLRTALPSGLTLHQFSIWLACPLGALQGRVSLWHTELTPEAGGTRLKCQRDDLSAFAGLLLGLDCDFRGNEPPELRAEFARLAQRCAAVQA
jgi:predicted DNA-binding transcriptional regulator YafY